MHEPTTWYETPLRKHFNGEGHDLVSEQSTRQRIDPSIYGLAWALAAGANRIPLIP
jgi:hypothetical protein